MQYGRSLGIEPKTEDVLDFQNFPGEGVYGSIEGKDIFIGNKRIANKAGYETGDPSFSFFHLWLIQHSLDLLFILLL